MSTLPIDVVLQAPPRAHPLAAALRGAVERVARREGVRLVEDVGAGVGAGAGVGVGALVLWVGLELPETGPPPCALALVLDAHAWDASPIWAVPARAFDQAIDGIERVQRLGSLLSACLDLAATPEGREVLRTDPLCTTPGVTHVLAGTAHLSQRALQEALARSLAARAATLIGASLDEGGAWDADDWSLPPALNQVAVVEALADGVAPDALRARSLAAAESLAAEVAASVDQALATHGLGAVIPLQAALERLEQAALPRPRAHAAAAHTIDGGGTPSDIAVRAAAARVAELPASMPGATLLSLGWAAPSGALAGLALGPSLDAPIAGSGYALAAAAGTATFVAGAGLAHLWAVTRKRLAQRAQRAAESDFATAIAEVEHERHAELAPEIVAGALTWFASGLARERQRLSAIESHVRGLARTTDGALNEPLRQRADDEVDAAVDLTPAKKLIDLAPESLLQKVRAELGAAGPGWREALPTLSDPLRAARAIVTGRTRSAPWVERSDVARALVPSLAAALAIVDGGLCRLVPRGLPVRRLALVPRPFEVEALGLPRDAVIPCVGDAHLLVCWRPS